MPALHIGLLTPSLAGVTGLGSGIGVHFRHLADALVATGNTVTCVLSLENSLAPPPPDLPFRIVSATARRPRLLSLTSKTSWQIYRWRMLRARHHAAANAAAALPGVDIWETTSTDTPALAFLRHRPRAPIITRVSTTSSQLRVTNSGAPSWIASREARWERAVVRGSDAVVTHTPGHREVLAREFGIDPTRVLLVPHGIPLPPDPATHTRGNLHASDADSPRLLFVGRLEHRKGIDLLLAALPTVLGTHPRARIDLVGHDANDYWANRWHTSASAPLRSRVCFRGLVSDADLARAYAEADIFVAPSRYESFGLIFVEAMARALPVVALAAPGALDLVEHERTGLLAPPEDAHALASALCRLLDDPILRHRLGRAGRVVAETRYSLDALVSASLRAYANVLRPSDALPRGR